MFCAGSGVSTLTGSWSYCMNTRFQYSRKRSFSPPGQVVLLAELEPAVDVQLAARAARAGRAGLPEVLLAGAAATIRSRGTPTDSHASIASSSGPRPSSSSPSKTVIQIFSGSIPKPSVESFQANSDGALLEVVADREVAEHLEERQVPVAWSRRCRCRGVRKTFWQVTSRWCGGCSRPRKYGLSGCMPGDRSAASTCRSAAARAMPTAAADGRWPRRTPGTCGGSRRSSWNDAV